MDHITFDQAMAVSDSWHQVKQIPNYVEVLGEALFEGLFEIEPRAMIIFKFDSVIDGDGNIASIKSHPAFPMHSSILVDMVDGAVAMLGPQMDMMEDSLLELGRRHAKYGVKPTYLPSMGTALVHALGRVLEDKQGLSLKVRHAWIVVFKYMVDHMVIGLRQALGEDSGAFSTGSSSRGLPTEVRVR